MVKLLYNEWVKFKKSNLVLWSILIASMPLIIGGSLVISSGQAVEVDGLKYMNSILWIQVRFNALYLFTYVASGLMAIEFKTEVLKILWAMPTSKTMFFFSKIIFLSIWSLMVSLLSFLLSLVFLKILIQGQLSLDSVLNNLLFFIVSSVLTWPFMYFSVLLVLLFKKIWVAMAINTIIFTSTLLLSPYAWSDKVPWLSPTKIMLSVGDKHNGASYLNLMLFACIVLYLGYQSIHKVEV